MTSRRRGIAAIAFGSAAALLVAGCSGGGAASPTAASSLAGGVPAKAGGTLYYLTDQAADHLDPQRTWIRRDIANETRMVYRTLTSYPVGSGKAGTKLVADLATDTGTASDGGKSWRFTLKDGVKWQDGSDITCADLKYGVSRTFATDVITGGPSYALQFLGIPRDPRGRSAYKGPYVRDAAGQALFDKAVTCVAKTITFNLSKPIADFNQVVSRPAFAPYKASLDKGDKSNFAVFSSGPYKLEGTWTHGSGGTFIRNANWSPGTDTIRRALPDKIVITEGLNDVAIAQRLISDQLTDRFAVTDRSIPPTLRPNVNVNPAMSTRSENVQTPFVDYLVPNFTRMTNPLVRQALAMSTNKSGWVAANGGTDAGTPAQSIIGPAVPGDQVFNALHAPDAGDPSKSRALLAQAGVKVPYPITVTFSGGTPVIQKAVAALTAGWQAGGFAVTVKDTTDTNSDLIDSPASADTYDVTPASWAPAWPSASSVIPPLFDSRVNLSATSNGWDYGYYKSDSVNRAIDAAYAMVDPTRAAQMWGSVDQGLARDVAYIPLRTQKSFLGWGSGVRGWVDNPAVFGYPDLASLGVDLTAK